MGAALVWVFAIGVTVIDLVMLLKECRRPRIRLGCMAGLVLSLLLGVLLIGAAMIPPFTCYRRDARHSLCINNMRLIDYAKEILAERNGWSNGSVIADTPEAIWAQIDPFIDGTNLLSCPEAPGRHYVYGAIGETPRCPVAVVFTEHAYRPDN